MTGEQLKQWRKRLEMTQHEAARALGYSRRQYARLETTDKVPPWVVRLTELIEQWEH